MPGIPRQVSVSLRKEKNPHMLKISAWKPYDVWIVQNLHAAKKKDRWVRKLEPYWLL